MAIDLPLNRIVPLSNVRLALCETPHGWEVENADDIVTMWSRETAANPTLFDGMVPIFSSLYVADGVLEGISHPVGYSALMHYKRHNAVATAHVFATAVLVASGGELIAARMAGHTSYPDRINFAAGTFDRGDVVDGMLDVDGNMHREVMEELGIDLSMCRADDGYNLFAHDKGTVIFRRYHLPMTAIEANAFIQQTIAAQALPEVTEGIILQRSHTVPTGAASYMPALMNWHFERS